MGKPSRFEIYFSPPEKQIFRPGETVEGFVELVLEKEQKFNNLAIEFYGRAEVHWISDSSKEHTAIRYVESIAGTHFSQISSNFFRLE